ncbi:MAG: glycosyl hydrolase 115 family protein [Muribaculaceae bacterium]|nr:glycosyl hydrolase 115 family protein [Muribaculaceae bacterium]
MKKKYFLIILTVILQLFLSELSMADNIYTLLPPVVTSAKTSEGDFPIVNEAGNPACIVYAESEYPGVKRAAADLADDIERVTGKKPDVKEVKNISQLSDLSECPLVVIGTLGKSAIADDLVKLMGRKKTDLKGKWEIFAMSTLTDIGNERCPMLAIVGSDKRGSIYGIYELSEQLGVSPWYWMADAAPKKKDSAYVKNGTYLSDEPKVRYRGIFINDEWPSFGTWCNNQFGGVNHKAYEKIFELLLRLRANYFWPAMWDTAFNEDDPLSPEVADEYGIVMGTSHHEPMMRAHKEYTRRRKEVGAWDYAKNPDGIEKFFREGLKRNRDYDNIITIGMRGDGDVAMGTGNDAENMATLKKVIEAQRRIIKDVYGKNPKEIPQLWAIFTEVQRYYDAGFAVPDDVTLLLCDNNWGYIRRKGREAERKRSGGLGLYYHIDMNGGPWNDRWVNTTTVPKLREQLNLAYQSGIDRIWIINVGDLKPKEMPIDFIMRYAWNPERIQPGDEKGYLESFAASVFGDEHAEEIADLIAAYSKYNLWRKPEAQYPGIFNYEEMLATNNLWTNLELRAEALKEKIPAEQQDAFHQLVYYPVVASAGVAKIYNSASIGDEENIRLLMDKDRKLSEYYNDSIAGGKWRGMMLDNHIGYTQWSIPEANRSPLELGLTFSHSLIPPADSQETFIPAYAYSNKTPGKDTEWILLPGLGRGDGCMGSANVMAVSDMSGNGATLEYEVTAISDTLTIAVGILPTQDILPERGLRLGISIDDGPITILDARKGLVDTFGEYTKENLAVSKVLSPLPERSRLSLSGYVDGRQLPRRDEVFDNIRWLDSSFTVTPGEHTLKIVMVDPEVVVEQIVVNPDNNRYGYFPNGFFTASKSKKLNP